MKEYMKFIKKLFKIGFIFSIIVFLFVVFVNLRINSFSQKYIFSDIEKLPEDSKIIMILGAKAYPNGNLSHMLYDRSVTAIEVYKSGKVNKILVSGDNGEKRYDEIRPTKKFLLENGVLVEDLFLDFAGFDTYDSMYRAKYIFQIDEMFISTQEFHLPRAIFIARKLGIDAYGIISDKREYSTISRNRKREILANIKAWFNVNFHSKPKYLGDQIPITGNANAEFH